MTNYPSSLDDDTTLPLITDNLSDIGAQAINALRDSTFAIENELGIGLSGTQGTLAARLAVFLNPDGTIKTSALAAVTVTLPIRNAQIASDAAIVESKLSLTFSTQALRDLITNIQTDLNTLLTFYNTSGLKIGPHIAGTSYNHDSSAILVNSSANITNQTGALRNNTNLQTILKDISDDLVSHEKSTGSVTLTSPTVNFAHNASGIHIDSSHFTSVSPAITDLQSFAQFIDSSSLLLLGTRVQSFYSNGISNSSRSSSLVNDGYGAVVVPPTLATSYLLYTSSTMPDDDIDHGDDLVEFFPSGLPANLFDAQFSQVKAGDHLRINYGGIEATYIILSVKFFNTGSVARYVVRINGKNLLATTMASARIDKPLFKTNKQNVLNISAVNNSLSKLGTLLVTHPRAASVIGIGFTPERFNSSHFNLYLEFYPDGNPLNKAIVLSAIDVTGNSGTTPGAYTLDYIVEKTNIAFRKTGYNYRFVAFQRDGNFGISLTDPYNNASFSIVSGIVNSTGIYDSAASATSFPNNVIGDSVDDPLIYQAAIDPLGLGSNGVNAASPTFSGSYLSPTAALLPTKIFTPFKRNYYYVNGSEKDNFKLEVATLVDGYGDGYWPATITSKSIFAGRIEAQYKVIGNLTTSGLAVGKTVVVQPQVLTTDPTYISADYGRFIISNISYDDTLPLNTTITVYDAVHGTGISPAATSAIGTSVRLYFTDDTISFNSENVEDQSIQSPYKRFFEVYVDSNGHTFTHERARFLQTVSSAQLNKINFYNVSTKLRGYTVNGLKQIRLAINSYDSITGLFSGNLYKYDPSLGISHIGPAFSSKKGEIVKAFDESNIDFIEFIFDANDTIASFTNQKVDIELFPSLELNEEAMVIGVCQLDDATKNVSHIKDKRSFGNVSEKQLSNSAIDFISAPEKYLHENGVVRGFDYNQSFTITNQLSFKGGLGLVNGKFLNKNETVITIPIIQQSDLSIEYNNITWYICLNDKNDLVCLPQSLVGNLFTALEPISNTLYTLDSVISLNELVTLRKDLLLLYQVNTTVTYSLGVATITINQVLDARRYTVDTGFNGEFIISAGNQIGHFKNFDSFNTWMNQLTTQTDSNSLLLDSVGVRVKLRGNFNLITPLILNFGIPVTIIGDGATITSTSSISLTNVNLLNVYSVTCATLSLTNSNIKNTNTVVANVNGLTTTGTCSLDAIGLVQTSTDAILSNGTTISNVGGFNITGNIIAGSPGTYTFKIDSVINITCSNAAINGGNIINIGNLSSTGTLALNALKISEITNLSGVNVTLTGIYKNIITLIASAVLTINGSSSLDTITTLTVGTNITCQSNVIINNINAINVNVGAGNITMGANCYITNIRTITASSVIAGSNFIMDRCPNVILQGAKGLQILSNTLILDSAFLYTNTIGGGFVNTDYVNNGNGCIYIESNLSNNNIYNVKIQNCIFNTTKTTRYSFINVNMTIATAIVDTLEISNCAFNSFGGNDYNYYAAISIISSVATGGGNTCPKLINTSIKNNRCDGNQLIIISDVLETVLGFSTVAIPSIGCINVKISDNICGAIGYWVGTELNHFTDLSGNSSLFNPSKIASLVIDNNTCHVIGCMNGTGAAVQIQVSTSILIQQVPGIVFITNNKANWLYLISQDWLATNLVGNTPFLPGPCVLKIKSNVLVAYDPTILAKWINPTVMGNTAIFIQSFLGDAGETTPVKDISSLVKISDNIIDMQVYINSSFSTFQYRYNNYLVTYATADITDNVFKGASSSFDLLDIRAKKAFIHRNKIFRFVGLNGTTPSTNPINSYIKGPSANTSLGSSFGMITENFFDSPTIDGTSTILVINIPSNWVYDRNINQTVEKLVSINSNKISITDTVISTNEYGLLTQSTGVIGFFIKNIGSFNNTTDLAINIGDVSTGTNTRNGYFFINLSEYVPVGSRIIDAKIGYVKVSGFNLTDCSFSSKIVSYLNNDNILDVKNYTGVSAYGSILSSGIDSDVTSFNISATTRYNFLDASSSPANDSLVVGNTNAVGYCFSFSFTKATTDAFSMYLSPLKIRYRYTVQ